MQGDSLVRAYLFIFFMAILLTSRKAESLPALILSPDTDRQTLEGHLVSTSYEQIVSELRDTPAPVLSSTYLTTGYKDSLWFKFSVVNPSSQAARMVLSAVFPLFTMVIIDQSTLQEVARTGASVLGKDKILALTPATFISFPAGESSFYLAVDVDGNPFVPMFEIFSQKRFFDDLQMDIFLFALFAGSMLTISLYILLFSGVMRDIYLASLAVTTIAYTLLEATIIGFPLLLEPPLSYRLGNAWLLWDAITMIGLTQLTNRFFNIKDNYPRLAKALHLFLLLSLFVPPIFKVQTLFIAAFYLGLQSLAMGSFLIVAIIEWRKNNRFAIGYLLSYLVVFAVSILFVLQIADVFPADIPLHKVRYFSAVICVIVLTAEVFMLADGLRVSHNNLRSSLAGLLSTKQINRLIDQGGHFSRAPVKKYITVMLIDIVGYSRTIRDLSPVQGFTALREILNDITTIIHRYDGIIDRSLGDGMLCFFGHSLLGVGSDDHEQRAFLSAIEIQQNSIKRVIATSEAEGRALFPLRIAIHSAPLCIGSLGEENRFEIALAGEGVFVAEKLEAVCEPHKIVVSKSAFDALPEMIRVSQGFSERLFPLTSQDNLEAGLEFDPFYDEQEVKGRAAQAYQKVIQITMRHERVMVKNGPLRLGSSQGPMEIVNFSHGGFCLRSNVYLGRGTQFELILTTFMHTEAMAFISPLTVEVLWGIIENKDGYLFGVRIPHLNDKQKDLILKELLKSIAVKQTTANDCVYLEG